jgi:hypothetical protein
MVRSAAVSGAKQQRSELLFSHHPAEFPECKERNENAKHHDAATSQLIEAYVPGSPCHIRSMDEPLNHFLNNVKGEH